MFYIDLSEKSQVKLYMTCMLVQVPIDACVVGNAHSAFLQQVRDAYYLHEAMGRTLSCVDIAPFWLL